jgi:glutamate racemase
MRIIDSATAMAEATADALAERGLAKSADRAEGTRVFLSTDSPELFAERAGRFLGTERAVDVSYP